MIKEHTLQINIQNQNPIPDPKTYTIRTLQDIADCVTSENIEGFLQDFELTLRSYLFIKSVSEETNPGYKVNFPEFGWIDDHKLIKKHSK